jgi:SagB-type dehydrogenase family enzyme
LNNRDIGAAWQYHDATKHSWQSVRASRHLLDWANRPLPYKIYSSLEPLPLPADPPTSSLPALEAIARDGCEPGGQREPDLAALGRLCLYSNGITKRRRYAGGGEMHFRAAACTGALYHIELYLACAELPGLAAGLYHYAAHDHALRRLRTGDFRGLLVDASGSESAMAEAAAIVICTSTFWRNAWKYQARAYRHCFWDGGVVLANLLAVAAAAELPAKVVLGFADEAVNRLLDLDPAKEAAICLVALGRTGQVPPPPPPAEPLGLPTAPLSGTEVDYPAIRAMHAASSLVSRAEAAVWREPAARQPHPPPGGPIVPLQPPAPTALPLDPIEAVIRRRGSTRRFARAPITFGQLSTMLERSTRGIPLDCLGVGSAAREQPAAHPPEVAGTLGDLYLIVNEVEGLEPGSYVLHRDRQALEPLRKGDFRAVAGELDLGQELAADAAANVYFLVDLRPLLELFGNRGYRLAQMAAAIEAGKLYLAAYALGLGATGLTFFDDDVTAFFSPHAAGKSVMFLMALGRPHRR